MRSIDFREDLNEYLTDEKRKILPDHLKAICKIYCKEKTCRYIFLSPIGYVCMKRTPAKMEIDRLVKKKAMISQSDNCPGLGENKIYGKKS